MDEILTLFLSIYVQVKHFSKKYMLLRVCSSQFPEPALAVRILSNSYVSFGN